MRYVQRVPFPRGSGSPGGPEPENQLPPLLSQSNRQPAPVVPGRLARAGPPDPRPIAEQKLLPMPVCEKIRGLARALGLSGLNSALWLVYSLGKRYVDSSLAL